MKADISTLLKPDILILQRQVNSLFRLFGPHNVESAHGYFGKTASGVTHAHWGRVGCLGARILTAKRREANPLEAGRRSREITESKTTFY
jgi:hypothetical protein